MGWIDNRTHFRRLARGRNVYIGYRYTKKAAVERMLKAGGKFEYQLTVYDCMVLTEK